MLHEYLAAMPLWKQLVWLVTGFGVSYWSAHSFVSVDMLRREKLWGQLFALWMMAVFGANGVFFLVVAMTLIELLMVGKSA
jgi:hypothetical protein